MIYLDNAATMYPKSKKVAEAMTKAFFGCGNGGRSGHPLSFAAAETVYNCREALSGLFGCNAEGAVLCSGATMALNMAIKGLYKKGTTVLCSVLEHNAVLRPLYTLEREGEINLRFFSPSLEGDAQTISNFKNALGFDVGLVVLTHASNVCGMCLPVKELCAISKEYGAATIIDCAQSAGHIPVNVKALGADVLCIAGHKGIGGPMGIGAVITHPDFKGRFNTVTEGGTGASSRDKEMPSLLPERLEAGTANITGIAGLAAACEELELCPQKEENLRKRLVEGLSLINDVKVYGAYAKSDYTPTVLFNVEKLPSDTVAETLAAEGICVRGGLHCAPLAHAFLGSGVYGGVRASIGRHNTEKDVDALLDAIQNTCKS